MCYFITYFLAIFLVFSDTFLIVSFPFLITKFLHASLISLISRQLQETVIVIEQPGQPGNLFLLLALILRTPSVPKGGSFLVPPFPITPHGTCSCSGRELWAECAERVSECRSKGSARLGLWNTETMGHLVPLPVTGLMEPECLERPAFGELPDYSAFDKSAMASIQKWSHSVVSDSLRPHGR